MLLRPNARTEKRMALQTTSRKVYLANLDDLQPGATLKFYNLSSLQYDGTARLVSLQPVTESAVTDAFRSALDALNILNQTATLSLATLDSDVKLTSQVELVDIEQVNLPAFW